MPFGMTSAGTGVCYGLRRWMVAVLRLTILSLLVLFGTAAAMAAAVDSVPRIDPAPSCRAASRAGNLEADMKNCLREEQAARDQLVKEWSSFRAADRASCVELSTVGGEPSYVELLTCLEMAKAAHEVPSDKLAPSDTAEPESRRRRP